MGRTLPTFNTFLQAEESSWRAYRRSLRSAAEKDAFAGLFTRARVYAAEATAAARPVPFDAIVMNILLSQEMEIRELRRLIQVQNNGQTVEEEAASENEVPLRKPLVKRVE